MRFFGDLETCCHSAKKLNKFVRLTYSFIYWANLNIRRSPVHIFIYLTKLPVSVFRQVL